MGINFSDSIARLRLQHASLNSKAVNKNPEDVSETENISFDTDKKVEDLNTDSFVHSGKNTTQGNITPDDVSVKHYKNAARAAAAVSQYGLNSGNAFILRKMTSFSDKNTS